MFRRTIARVGPYRPNAGYFKVAAVPRSDGQDGCVAVNPTGAALKAFVAAAPEQPVVMLNLLRFAEGGAERYERYLAHLERHAEKVGARILYYGRGIEAIVAEAGQAWDAVLLVAYPSRRAFSEMVRDPGYQRGTHLRTEALSEAVLQPTVPAGQHIALSPRADQGRVGRNHGAASS